MRLGFRFSMRTMFLVLIVIAVAMAWHVKTWRSAQSQKQVVERIRAARGRAVYDFDFASYRNTENILWPVWASPEREPTTAAPAVPDWLLNLLGIDYFSSVRAVIVARYDGSHSGFDPPTLAQMHSTDRENAKLATELVQLQSIEELQLDWVPPEALQGLAAMPGLKRVVFRQTVDARHVVQAAKSSASQVELWGDVDDEQLVALSSSVNVTGIRAHGFNSTFTDQGVRVLCGMAQLKSLKLRSDHVTNRSVAELTRLQELTEIELRFPRVTIVSDAIKGKPVRKLVLSTMVFDEATFKAIGDLRELEMLCLDNPISPDTAEDPGARVGDGTESLASMSPASLKALCTLTRLKQLRLVYALSATEIQVLLRCMPLRYLCSRGEIDESDGAAIVLAHPQVELCFEVFNPDPVLGGIVEVRQQFIGAERTPRK